MFGGLIGQAVQGLSEGTFQKVIELTPAFARAVAAPDELTLLRLTGGMEKDKALADGVLGALGLVFRDAAAARFGGAVRPAVHRAGRGGGTRPFPDPGTAPRPRQSGGRAAGRPAAEHELHPVPDPAVQSSAERGGPITRNSVVQSASRNQRKSLTIFG